METKNDIDFLIKRIKSATGLNQEGIAKRVNYSREYLSQVKRGNPDKLYSVLEKEFANELSGRGKPSAPGDPLNRERAIIKVLFHRMIKVEAERLGISEEKAKAELEKDTNIALSDLEED